MVEVQKTLPTELEDNSKYLVRVRSINNFGVSSDWSESIVVNTETIASQAGSRLVLTEDSIYGYNSEGALSFGYFGQGVTRKNLSNNPSFENDTSGYVISNAFSSLVISADYSRYGTHSLKVSPTATASGIGFANSASGAFVVSDDELYTVSMYILSPVTNSEFNIRLGIEFLNAADQSLGIIWSAQESLIKPTGEWFRISQIGVEPPPNALSGRIKLETTDPLTFPTEVYYVDAVLIEETDVLREYFDGNIYEDYGATWLGTAHNSVSVVTQNVGDVFVGGSLIVGSFIPIGGAANDINSHGTEISGGKIQTGTITASQIAVGTITATQIAGSTITGDKISSSTTLTVGTGATKIEIAGTGTTTTTVVRSTNETAYATGSGFWMDASGRFSLGDKLTWNGSTLSINGGGTFSGSLSAATGTFAGSLSAATGTFSGSLSAASGTFTGTVSAGTITGSTITGGTINIGSGDFTVDSGGNVIVQGGVTGSFMIRDPSDPTTDYVDSYVSGGTVFHLYQIDGSYGIISFDPFGIGGFAIGGSNGDEQDITLGGDTRVIQNLTATGASRQWPTMQLRVQSTDGASGSNSSGIALWVQGTVAGYAPIIDCFENNGSEAVRIINNANTAHQAIQASAFNPISSMRIKEEIHAPGGFLDKGKQIEPKRYRPNVRATTLRPNERFLDINNRWVAKGHKPLTADYKHMESKEHNCSIDHCNGSSENPCSIILNDGYKYGFIAEEVYQIYPELVVIDAEKLPMAVDLAGLTAVAWGMARELALEVETLKARIETLES